jgi:predicted nucleic acid-binding protein
MTADVAASALVDLVRSPLSRHPHYLFLRRVWEVRSSLTAYDGAYLALAEFLGAPLITLDARIARAIFGVSVEVF